MRGQYKNHHEMEVAKLKVRDIQYLQVLLQRQDFLTMIQKLNVSQEKSTLNKISLSKIENYLTQLRLTESPYGLKIVIEVARAMQKEFKKNFDKEDSVEIFGSFPNLNANFKRSDIDLFFSEKLDNRIRREIKGGFMGDGGISALEANQRTGSAKDLTNWLAQMEAKAAAALGLSRNQGDLFGITTLPMTNTRNGPMPESSREDFMHSLTRMSCVTIIISSNGLTLRIYDSISPKNVSTKPYYDFIIK